MSKGEKTPVTPAVRFLRREKVTFTHHLYTYVEKGGTAIPAAALGVAEHAVVKTLIMADDAKAPFIVLMHGDRMVSTKALARAMGVKRVGPCDPAVAQRHSGYRVGGTSPFGTKRQMPVFMERSVLDLPTIYINGGHRGYLVGVSPEVVAQVTQATLVDVAN
ncbi:MAG: aminoacyl-tRNA deacylase [Lentisphaerae bacterium]|jgi:Cys-tRNA(Pro) deacylase|nr:aminoacyl-tRNA deacylase [Lentisphaerota bacterium]MBT4819292.1 aminoacyl-tRNA deacylase [Lentisphaerota bacterium]MBT5610544.1 aminoacyl-tRNA deacylase [Lentisphaerota bacterium]MBT7054416.1 aminoacyl-tRNA deacylase [Lentisphaerota bacterium]MBT7842585.1 aminoacyl-tRNA deacylase [Lentisphaerota bacterium]